MAVTAVKLLTFGETGTQTIQNQSIGIQKSYQATYQVSVSSPSDSVLVVLAGVDPTSGLQVPQLGTSFFGDSAANCTTVNPARGSGRTRLDWKVQCTFTTPNNGKKDKDGNPSDNPFQWRSEYSWKGAKFTRPVDYATLETALPAVSANVGDNIPCINSAGDVFDPAPERDDSRALFTETQYLQNFPSQFLDYVDTINASPFTITATGFSQTFDTKCAKFEPIDAQLKYHTPKTGPEIAYWEVKITLSINWDNWDILLVDRGPNRFVGPGVPNGHVVMSGTSQNYPEGTPGIYTAADFPPGKPNREKITDKNHKPTGPVLLDGFGNPLLAGQPPKTITYQIYETNDFSALGL